MTSAAVDAPIAWSDREDGPKFRARLHHCRPRRKVVSARPWRGRLPRGTHSGDAGRVDVDRDRHARAPRVLSRSAGQQRRVLGIVQRGNDGRADQRDEPFDERNQQRRRRIHSDGRRRPRARSGRTGRSRRCRAAVEGRPWRLMTPRPSGTRTGRAFCSTAPGGRGTPSSRRRPHRSLRQGGPGLDRGERGSPLQVSCAQRERAVDATRVKIARNKC